MSKSTFKHKKSNYFYDDEEDEGYFSSRNFRDKRKEKRINRALKTKDISALTEEDELDDWESHVSSFEEERY